MEYWEPAQISGRKRKSNSQVRLAKSRCEQALEVLGWHATRTPDRRQDHFPKNEVPANVPPERSVPGSARMCLDVWYWPKAAELGDAIGRQLSGVHRTCCQCSRDGSPRPRAAEVEQCLILLEEPTSLW